MKQQIQKLVRVPNKFNAKHSAANVKPNYTKGLYHHPAPSVGIQTPDAFLPPNDPRRGMYTQTANAKLAPALSEPKQSTYSLTPTDVDEIKKLRYEHQWTRKDLADKFGVSPFTISLVSDPNPDVQEEMGARLDMIKDQWSEGRKKARLNREKAKKLWYRDE